MVDGRGAVLRVEGVDASYERTKVLRDVAVTVQPGQVVGLLGANGAGKSTLLRVIAGLLRPTSGSIVLDGESVVRLSATRRTRAGVCLIPEGRGIFRNLTVRENLQLFLPRGSPHHIDAAVEAFPVLGQRLQQVAGRMSGGEQQMLALSKAYLCEPQLVMADELSLGLGPIVVDGIYASLAALNARGVGLLIVEQYVNRIISMADHVYVMAHGSIAWSGPAADLDEEQLVEQYLGA